MFSRLGSIFGATISLGSMILCATNPTIGVATSTGTFVLDRSPIVGNANVYQGSVVETKNAISDVSLTNGLKMRLGAESRAKLFLDSLFLEKGAGQVSGSMYKVTAGRFRVIPTSVNSVARVVLATSERVDVASLLGSLQVQTERGIPVANLAAGTALSFSGQAGASTPTKIHGKVEFKNGKYTLTDTTTKVTFELQGENVQQYVGKTITATGNVEGTNTLQVLNAAVDVAGAGLSTAAIAGITIAVVVAVGLGPGIAAANGAFSNSVPVSASR